MDTFSLYDETPLFSGDLLVGWGPLADEHPTVVQDDLQPTEQAKCNLVDDISASNYVLDTPKGEKVFDGKMFGVTKMNLLDLLESSGSACPDQAPEFPLPSNPVTSDLLSTVSDMLVANIGSGVTQHHNDDVTVINIKISDDVPITTTADFMSDDVASFLSSNEHNVCDDVESFLAYSGSENLVADILSPVSPEDVEYLLSAGPTSPCSSSVSLNESERISPSPALSPSPSISSSHEMANFTSDYSALDDMPTSDYSALDDMPITISMKYLREELLKPTPTVNEHYETEEKPVHRPRRSRVRQEPYSPPPTSRPYNRILPDTPEKKGGSDVRKSRKKQQNKSAALRYRHKKREEKVTVSQECENLEKRNQELHEKVDSMTREIQYLKDLLAEVYQAKSATKSKFCK